MANNEKEEGGASVSGGAGISSALPDLADTDSDFEEHPPSTQNLLDSIIDQAVITTSYSAGRTGVSYVEIKN